MTPADLVVLLPGGKRYDFILPFTRMALDNDRASKASHDRLPDHQAKPGTVLANPSWIDPVKPIEEIHPGILDRHHEAERGQTPEYTGNTVACRDPVYKQTIAIRRRPLSRRIVLDGLASEQRSCRMAFHYSKGKWSSLLWIASDLFIVMFEDSLSEFEEQSRRHELIQES